MCVKFCKMAEGCSPLILGCSGWVVVLWVLGFLHPSDRDRDQVFLGLVPVGAVDQATCLISSFLCSLSRAMFK